MLFVVAKGFLTLSYYFIFQLTAKTTNQNKTQTAIDEDLQTKSLDIAEKAPPTVDTEQKCVDNTSDIITNINADTEKVWKQDSLSSKTAL